MRSRISRPLDLTLADTILVLGNQKTGSSAIAGLLAARTGNSLATDITDAWTREFALAHDRTLLEQFIKANRRYFRHDIVKENSITLAADGLFAALPRARGVFVVRHPVNNIRSILDRLNWPGDPSPLESLPAAPGAWRQVVDVRPWGVDVADHITSLAHRWRLSSEAILRNRSRGILVRYEDFDDDKVSTIDHLADELGFRDRKPIHHLLDHAFQPKGTRRNDPVQDHFSEQTLALITQICSESMNAFGYDAAINNA